MHKSSGVRDYMIALLIAMSLMTFFSFYLFIRRGYFFNGPSTVDALYVFNEAIIGVGTALLALTFLIGPITRYFDRFDKWISYRKEIGIVGGFLAVSHGAISYFLLPIKFPQSRFTFDNLPFVAGLLGVIVLIFLFIISFKKIIDTMNGEQWWFLQRWGLRLVISFTLAHVYIMKWNGWVKWFNEGGARAPTAELAHPFMPGAGILVMLFVTWVVVIRIYESAFLFRNCGFKAKELCMDTSVKARGRRFFIQSLWVLVALYVVALTRFVF